MPFSFREFPSYSVRFDCVSYTAPLSSFWTPFSINVAQIDLKSGSVLTGAGMNPMKRILPLLIVLITVNVQAQSILGRRAAKYAASRGNLQIGLTGAYLRPDYGGGVGGMLTPYIALDLKKSHFGGEVDYNRAIDMHSAAKPNSLMFGLRVVGDAGPFRLYVKPAIGWGHFSGVTTTPSGGSENYFVYEVSGGTDMRLTRHINARAFITYQIWPNFDGDTTAQFRHGGGLNPIFAGGGLAYHF